MPRSLKLNTSILFQLLLKVLRPDIVCDVGSHDAAQARRFRRLLPAARILALEANPRNASLLSEDARLRDQSIELIPKAAWNHDGVLRFYVERLSIEPGQHWRCGISSTRPRLRGSLGADVVEVPAVRLDTLLHGLEVAPQRIALWIDTEGASYEVLEGARAVASRVVLVHAEVESRELWAEQRLGRDVRQLMHDMGFIELARGIPELQHDCVFVRAERRAASHLAIGSTRLCALALTQAQRVAGGALHGLAQRWLR